jgi:hypothetical protein
MFCGCCGRAAADAPVEAAVVEEEDSKAAAPVRLSSRSTLPPASQAAFMSDGDEGDVPLNAAVASSSPHELAAELKERLLWLRANGTGGTEAGGAVGRGGVAGGATRGGPGGDVPPGPGEAPGAPGALPMADPSESVVAISEVELLMSLMPAPTDCVDVNTLRDAVNLVPSLHELFNHYSLTVAVSAKRRDGTSVTFDATAMDMNAFVNQSGSGGPVVDDQDFVRMLQDYGVVPKLVSYTVRRACVRAAAGVERVVGDCGGRGGWGGGLSEREGEVPRVVLLGQRG